ncbi:MAG: helix-turn-helix domain-containing protein [Arcobacter sp.]|uniref:helix-turn-helix domain-containing protein n=1 Tax=Arcobacter sp. TaxID=1872629 RepID=UPI003C7859F2
MKKINQNEFAQLLEISHPNISQWKDKNKIPAERCMTIAPILRDTYFMEISAEELFKNPKLLFDLFTSGRTITDEENESTVKTAS